MQLVSNFQSTSAKCLFVFLILNTCFNVQVIGQSTFNGSIFHNGISRDYILYVPAIYNKENPAPLLLCFHGFTSSAENIYNYSNFKSIADTAGFLLVCPQGTLLNGDTHWNVGGWTLSSTADDVGFTAALIDSISAEFTINEKRVYSTGMSNGGYMSFLLACELSDKIAAIASVTGSMTPQTFAACDPSHQTPVLQIHGTDDRTVPYKGAAAWTKSIEDVLNYWVNYNNCSANATKTSLPNTNTNDGSTVELYEFAEGDNCANVEHLKVIGGDHDWPGAWGNKDINASKEVWQFLSRYNIDGKIDCKQTNIGSKEKLSGIELFPNPASNFIVVTNELGSLKDYAIYNSLGEMVKKGVLLEKENIIGTSKLPTGAYFLKVDNEVSWITIRN